LIEHASSGLYAILGIGGIALAVKAIDWLISLKYKTKDDCELCRKEIKETEQNNHDLLISLNTKVDLLLNGKHIKIEDE
jgi:hypothetical protein